MALGFTEDLLRPILGASRCSLPDNRIENADTALLSCRHKTYYFFLSQEIVCSNSRVKPSSACVG
jgi:hypothetical protein